MSLFYIKTQCLPRSKRFAPRLDKTKILKYKVALFSEIGKKNTQTQRQHQVEF
jgi:hypothetical protein